MVYTLTNTVNDGADIRWSAFTNRDWITLSSTGGTLAGGQSATVRVAINSRANGLESQLFDYTGTITFRDQTNGDDRERDFALEVTVPESIEWGEGSVSAAPDSLNAAGGRVAVFISTLELGTTASAPEFSIEGPGLLQLNAWCEL